MWTHLHVARSLLEESCVIIRGGDPYSRRPWNLVVVATSLFLLVASGCTKQDPYTPPDLFYYFASYKVGKNPTTVTPIDVNQDGLTDLLTTNIGSDTLSILLGNGDGTFRDQIQLSTCKEPRSLALGMFNRDPYPDVVLACSGGDEVAVLFGRADGKFEEGPRYPVHRTPIAIASDDLNGDQAPDLVVALRNDKIKVFLGTGTGEFTHGAQYEYGDTPTSVALADLNGDGKVDLAVTNGGPMSNAVSIWMGNGDGTFRPPTDYRTGKRPLGVSFADFNRDRIHDLFASRTASQPFSGTVMGLSSQGSIPVPTQDRISGSLATSTATVVPTWPSSIFSRVISPFSSAGAMGHSNIRRETIGQNQAPSLLRRFASQRRRLKSLDL
jgi:FG-GAP-like repeat